TPTHRDLPSFPTRRSSDLGLPRSRARSFWVHGVLVRAVEKLDRGSVWSGAEAWLHSLFWRWVARQLKSGRWDVAHLWSGVAEERSEEHTSELQSRFDLVCR